MRMPRKTTALAALLLLALAAPSPSGGAEIPHRGGGQPRLFAPAARPLAVGDAPSALATIDMKGDGYDELLVASAGSNRVEVLTNRLGRIRATSRNPVGVSPTAIATDGGGEGDRVLV